MNKQQFSEYLKQNISFNDYDINPTNAFSGAVELFRAEKDWHIRQVGEVKAFNDWLNGLPSCLDIPFYYWDIRNLLYSFGLDDAQNMDDDIISNLYYDTITQILLER